MSTQRQHVSAHQGGALRRLGTAAMLLMCVGLAACTAAGPPAAAPTAQTEVAVPLPLNGVLDAGTYTVTGFTVPFEVTVPDDWRILDGWRLIRDVDGLRTVFLTFLNPTHVPADACAWDPPLPAVEPTMDAFADALVAQKSTSTTPPTEVAVGDYRGVEFDIWVDEDIDNSDCRGSHVCIYGEASNDCARWYMSVDERETYRVVDLHGDRAVLSVGQYTDDVDDVWLQEARAVFDSIVFRSGE